MIDNMIKVVVVGDYLDRAKTKLLQSLVPKEVQPQYIPSVFDGYQKNVTLNGNTYSLLLFDTSGDEDYDKLRPTKYYHTDIVIIHCSLTDESSFDRIQDMWYPEISHHLSGTPIVVAALKPENEKAIVTEEQQKSLQAFLSKQEKNNIRFVDYNLQSSDVVLTEALNVYIAKLAPDKKSIFSRFTSVVSTGLSMLAHPVANNNNNNKPQKGDIELETRRQP